MANDPAPSPIRDPRVNAVLARLQSERRRHPTGGPLGDLGASRDPLDYAKYGFSIAPEQGDLIYLLCRGLRTKRVAEFATSIGVSTLYFAAAMRDNGGGMVIGSELVPAKIEAARRNLAEAGLADYAEIRQGDARQTLRELGGPVDFVLIDGWPVAAGPSLAREVIEIVTPQIRVGGHVINDNAESDFLDFVRNPSSGFLSITLPLKGGTELSVKVA
jgi:predicted O-methyltransferase YrrM